MVRWLFIVGGGVLLIPTPTKPKTFKENTDMKLIALTTAAVFATTSAFAGTLELMVMDEKPMVEMVEEPAGSGALAWIIPVIAIVAIAVAADD